MTAAKAHTHTATPQPISLIMVEDNPMLRTSLNQLLSRQVAVNVLGSFETAEDALRYLEAHPGEIPVVLMDVGLPGMSGIEATQKIKQAFPQVHVLVLTSLESKVHVKEAMGAGAHGYCLKNVATRQLVQIIETIHSGGIWLDPVVAEEAMEIFQGVFFDQLPTSPHTVVTIKPELVNITSEDVAQTETLLARAHEFAEQHNKPRLTPREVEVLRLLVEGKSNTQIAKALTVSSHTVKAHVTKIFQKLKVNDRVQAAIKALQEGYLHP